ncbi:MAG: trypsin-like peptidase domain-containing protein [Spirochaetales bacterium]|nr:trypsin-like peptidase domain-containing protein [Spirochaetales bacterium]
MKFPLLKFSILIFIILFFSPVIIFAVEKTSSAKGDLVSGRIMSGSLDLSEEGQSYQTFRFKVPEDTFAVRLTLKNSPADLDIFIKRGEEIQSYDLVDYFSTEEDYNESILITRLSELPLENDIYYVDISYQRDSFPIINGRRASTIPFKIVMEQEKYELTDTLIPGRPVQSEILPENGMAALYALKVPANTEAFRIDIYNTGSDLDLMVSHENKLITRENNDYLRESLLGKETLIIEETGNSPLKSGIYYIMVFDQISNDHPVEFSILAELNRQASEELTKIPRFPAVSNEVQNVLFATAEVIGNAGKGSGCFVSSKGHIITNWHVIEDFTGDVSKDIYVAINLSNELPPVELFKATLIDYSIEKDLALIQVSSGLYENPIPLSYRFPFFSLGNSDTIQIGQPLSYLGYPGIGGSGSRASISLTRGIVSGFERTNGNLLLKTDAEINSGNSGGAAIDSFYELIGFPTSTIEEDAGQLGYITPVSMIPEDWYQYIGR